MTTDSPDSGAPATRWPRDIWYDAIWDSPTVKPNERVVAYAYARYAARGNITWCVWDELIKRTGIKSRNGVWLALKGLIAAGWLIEHEPARQHYSARYRLAFPKAQKSPVGTPELSAGDSGVPKEDTPAVPKGKPAVPEEKPVVPLGDPISLTHHSDLSLGAEGRVAPQTPRREPTPSGRVIDQPMSPSVVVNDQADLATQLTTRATGENVVDFAAKRNKLRRECANCDAWLDPDGSCFTCRTTKTAP